MRGVPSALALNPLLEQANVGFGRLDVGDGTRADTELIGQLAFECSFSTCESTVRESDARSPASAAMSV
jgi:hypothetical protein